MDRLLTFLDGKKLIIGQIISTVIAFLVARSILSPDWGALIQSILAILGIGAVYQTNKTLGRRNRLN